MRQRESERERVSERASEWGGAEVLAGRHKGPPFQRGRSFRQTRTTGSMLTAYPSSVLEKKPRQKRETETERAGCKH